MGMGAMGRTPLVRASAATLALSLALAAPLPALAAGLGGGLLPSLHGEKGHGHPKVALGGDIGGHGKGHHDWAGEPGPGHHHAGVRVTGILSGAASTATSTLSTTVHSVVATVREVVGVATTPVVPHLPRTASPLDSVTTVTTTGASSIATTRAPADPPPAAPLSAVAGRHTTAPKPSHVTGAAVMPAPPITATESVMARLPVTWWSLLAVVDIALAVVLVLRRRHPFATAEADQPVQDE
jgi:hypothetical protein